MEDTNRVNVKIYGQEYTICGDKPKDHIIKIADYVDKKMQEMAAALPTGYASALPVLTAVNLADDYMGLIGALRELQAKNQELEKDAQHYVQMWDEMKRSLLKYKEDAQSNQARQEEMQQALARQADAQRELTAHCKEAEERCETLKRRNEDLTQRLQAQADAGEGRAEALKELESRCKEMEGSYFDLQMENIQLKGEIERYKKIVE